jgi:hypothetical protein
MEKNPYDILGVSPAASKAEITKAVAVAMKRKQYPVDVIAKAQKSLMKPEERIIADYLRPILPTIKRFKYSDLSALDEPEPILTLLAEFDGLEAALIKAAREEVLECEPVPIAISELFVQGVEACKEKRYPKAIKYLEDYCEKCNETNSQDFLQTQIYLIKAYHACGQIQRAITLCQRLTTTPSNPQLQAWAKNALSSLLSKEMSHV